MFFMQQTLTHKIIFKNLVFLLYIGFLFAIIKMALLGGLGRAPTFLVPIINPPFADRQPALTPLPTKESAMDTQRQLSKRYERITNQLTALFKQPSNPTAQMSTTCALLHHKMPHYFWTGYYLLQNNRLIVGPYQGPLACQILAEKKGVCWAGVLDKKTVIVPNVHEFPGHVACDSRSNSEIVIPWLSDDGNVLGVLDVDSRKFDAFSEIDREWLERIVGLLKLDHTFEKTHTASHNKE
jgi:GAF domain-containing protein